MKFAVTTMNYKKSAALIFSFFITGRGIALQRTPLGIFRALLNSILEFFPESLARLVKLFRDREKRFGNYQEDRWKWNEKEL